MSNGAMPTPTPFLEVRVHRLDLAPGLTGLCAGYEQGAWRDDQLAGHLMKWIPEFALKHSEREALNSATAVEMMQQAAKNIFATDKYSRRGEFGELLLHVAIRQCFDTLPAISKIYYKDGPNETVKGFDAVHVVTTGADLELWLGEVKFYEDLSTAISHVVAELLHFARTDSCRRVDWTDQAGGLGRLLVLHPATATRHAYAAIRWLAGFFRVTLLAGDRIRGHRRVNRAPRRPAKRG